MNMRIAGSTSDTVVDERACSNEPIPTSNLGRHVLSQRASFWVAAAVVSHTLWTSAAPAMSYPLFASAWNLTTTATTAIYAIYPVVVVAVLTFFGDISDYVGRRTAMLLGVGASLAGALIFAVAPDILWIFAARALMGVGVGLSAGPSTAAVIEFSAPDQCARASSITTAAQALGLAAAMLVGGALIEYAPFPTRLNFWVLSIILAGLFAATWFLPRRVTDTTMGRWRMKLPSVPRTLRTTFIVSAAAVTTGYTVAAVVQSLGAQIALDLVGSSNAFVNGAALSLFAIVFGVVSVLCKRLAFRAAIMLGGVASMAAMALLALSTARHSLWVFLGASAGAGIGYSLLFMGGLRMLSSVAPAERRGGTLSALYLVAYLAMGAVALLLGKVATASGLGIAIDLGATTIALLAAVVIVLVVLTRNSPAHA
jgi:MFS family permease